jgi:hypothetical protein
MMGYLDRLKRAVSEKQAPSVLPKLSKAPYGSFDSSQDERFQKINATNETTLTATTEGQGAELRRLVPTVCAHYCCPAEEVAEALALALADPEAALESYRAMNTDREAFEERARDYGVENAR